jgi:hypothetical protein
MTKLLKFVIAKVKFSMFMLRYGYKLFCRCRQYFPKRMAFAPCRGAGGDAVSDGGSAVTTQIFSGGRKGEQPIETLQQ